MPDAPRLAVPVVQLGVARGTVQRVTFTQRTVGQDARNLVRLDQSANRFSPGGGVQKEARRPVGVATTVRYPHDASNRRGKVVRHREVVVHVGVASVQQRRLHSAADDAGPARIVQHFGIHVPVPADYPRPADRGNRRRKLGEDGSVGVAHTVTIF